MNQYDVKPCKLVSKQEIQPGIFDFRVENRDFAKAARPGQFAHLLVPGKTLRRPISICDVEGDCLRLVFQIRGEGTEILSKYQVGGELDLLAPLGRGFQLGDTNRRVVFVGGGIGVPPLLYGARQFKENATVILGFRDQNAVILKRDFEAAGCRVILTTDDGSAGIRSLVTGPLKDVLAAGRDAVFACGPTPMLKGVGQLSKEYKVPCQLSLEERMGCGVGACLVCACKIRRNDGSETYLHVCKDGPVFNAEEVLF